MYSDGCFSLSIFLYPPFFIPPGAITLVCDRRLGYGDALDETATTTPTSWHIGDGYRCMLSYSGARIRTGMTFQGWPLLLTDRFTALRQPAGQPLPAVLQRLCLCQRH